MTARAWGRKGIPSVKAEARQEHPGQGDGGQSQMARLRPWRLRSCAQSRRWPCHQRESEHGRRCTSNHDLQVGLRGRRHRVRREQETGQLPPSVDEDVAAFWRVLCARACGETAGSEEGVPCRREHATCQARMGSSGARCGCPCSDKPDGITHRDAVCLVAAVRGRAQVTLVGAKRCQGGRIDQLDWAWNGFRGTAPGGAERHTSANLASESRATRCRPPPDINHYYTFSYERTGCLASKLNACCRPGTSSSSSATCGRSVPRRMLP